MEDKNYNTRTEYYYFLFHHLLWPFVQLTNYKGITRECMRDNHLFYDNVHFFSIWLKLMLGYLISGNPHNKMSKQLKKKIEEFEVENRFGKGHRP